MTNWRHFKLCKRQIKERWQPQRIQQKRKSRGWRMPPNTVYVGRGSAWGNPFKVAASTGGTAAGRIDTGNVAFNTQLLKAFGDRKMTREDCVLAYRIYLDYAGIEAREGWWPQPKDLRGKNLACWCSEGPCHGDVLLEKANA